MLECKRGWKIGIFHNSRSAHRSIEVRIYGYFAFDRLPLLPGPYCLKPLWYLLPIHLYLELDTVSTSSFSHHFAASASFTLAANKRLRIDVSAHPLRPGSQSLLLIIQPKAATGSSHAVYGCWQKNSIVAEYPNLTSGNAQGSFISGTSRIC